MSEKHENIREYIACRVIDEQIERLQDEGKRLQERVDEIHDEIRYLNFAYAIIMMEDNRL